MTADGNAWLVRTGAATGAILPCLLAGEHLLTMDFRDTPVRPTGAWVMLASFVLVLAAAGTGALVGRRKELV